MSILVYVGCGKAKQDTSGLSVNELPPAKELYTSGYFQTKRSWADEVSSRWEIISARHGTLPPDAGTRAYDAKITSSGIKGPDSKFETIDEWAEDVVDSFESTAQVCKESAIADDLVAVVLLAGRAYINPLIEGLESVGEEYGITVVDPFKDSSGMFDQMGMLSDDLERLEEGRPPELLPMELDE